MEQIKEESAFTRENRDLLIELKTKIEALTESVNDLKKGTTERIACLERDKADRAELDALQAKVNHDIEIRVRKNENKIVWVYAWAACIGFLASIVMKYIIK